MSLYPLKMAPNLISIIRFSSYYDYSLDPGILVPEKKVNFFWAPIQKAHEYVLNLQRQLSSSLASVAAHRSKFGIFTVTKHPSIRAFVPKKSNLKFFCVPDELGSQIVLRIYSECQCFRIRRPFRFWKSLARDMGDRVTLI